MTFNQILIQAASKRPLYFRAKGDRGTFLFNKDGRLRYLNASGRDSRVSLEIHDFRTTYYQIVSPPEVQKTDG